MTEHATALMDAPTAPATDQGPDVHAAVLADNVQLRIPSRPEWIVPTVEFLTERAVRDGACHKDRAANLTLALHEALTNSVVHGNLELSSELKEQGDDVFAEALAARAADPLLSGRVVDIRADYDGDACRWTFTDQGRGFDVARALARAASDDPEILLASGRGIVLMKALLEDVRYDLGGRRVELTIQRAGDDKRRHTRRPLQQTARVVPLAADGSVDWASAYDALGRNLSEGGIALLQDRLAAAPRVLIGLDWEGEVLYVPAEIRHCETLGEGMVQLGCRFQAAIGPSQASHDAPAGELADAIDTLFEKLDGAKLAPHERRTHQRVVFTERIGLSGGPGPSVGFARNLSKGGMSLLVHQPLPLESRVLSLPRRDAPPLRIRGRVIRCDSLMAGVYEVAVRFEGIA